METGDDSVVNLFEENSNDSTVADALSVIHNGIEFGKSTKSQNNTGAQKPNVFELIGGNKNCDNNNESNDCNKKTTLNSNDVTIGFVDDDDETNGEIDGNATTSNRCDSDEAAKGHENNNG